MGKFRQFLTSYLPTMSIFLFLDNNLSQYQWISPNKVCQLILWKSGLGLRLGKFCQVLTELSACLTIVAGCYRFVFIYSIETYAEVTLPLEVPERRF